MLAPGGPAESLVLAATVLGGLYGLCLTLARRLDRVAADPTPSAASIDALLPQTQCGRCGYAGCRPYAEAIAAGEAINKCPPGGQDGVNALAELLQLPSVELDPCHGAEEPRTVAFIVEADCIGCTKCIQACPVDAIFGAAKQMHTVIESECTGCDLCVDPCPVDCIEMHPVASTPPASTLHTVTVRPAPLNATDAKPSTAMISTPHSPLAPAAVWTRAQANLARDRFEARRRRLAADAAQKKPRRRKSRVDQGPLLPPEPQDISRDVGRTGPSPDAVHAALARAKSRRERRNGPSGTDLSSSADPIQAALQRAREKRARKTGGELS